MVLLKVLSTKEVERGEKGGDCHRGETLLAGVDMKREWGGGGEVRTFEGGGIWGLRTKVKYGGGHWGVFRHPVEKWGAEGLKGASRTSVETGGEQMRNQASILEKNRGKTRKGPKRKKWRT